MLCGWVVTTDPHSASILLVDDDREILKALTKVLEKEGYRVTACADARDALAEIRGQPGAVDLVISDISMPRMQGFEFLAELKSLAPGLPVIVISAFGDWGQCRDALRQGAYEYLSKPLDKPALLTTIRRVLATAART